MSDARARTTLPGFDHLLAAGQIDGARPYQEDDYRVRGFRRGDPDGSDVLMVLADGMGGHVGGAEASRLAVSTVVERFERTTGGIAARLRASLDAANAAISEVAKDPRYAGLGCTLVACVVTDNEMAHWISVGDSPLWRLRGSRHDGGGMDRLNDDHSMRPVLENLVRLGQMTQEEAAKGGAHQLRSAVTGEKMKFVDAGAGPVRLHAGDSIVMASDGLETLSNDDILDLARGRRSSLDIVSDLLKAVRAVGSPTQDNATVVVYRHLGAAAFRRQYRSLTAPTQRVVARR